MVSAVPSADVTWARTEIRCEAELDFVGYCA